MDWGESEMGEIKILMSKKKVSKCEMQFVWVLDTLFLL